MKISAVHCGDPAGSLQCTPLQDYFLRAAAVRFVSACSEVRASRHGRSSLMFIYCGDQFTSSVEKKKEIKTPIADETTTHEHHARAVPFGYACNVVCVCVQSTPSVICVFFEKTIFVVTCVGFTCFLDMLAMRCVYACSALPRFPFVKK